MNKKLKKGLTVSSAAAMGMSIVLPTVAVIAAPAVTNGWVQSNGTWYYYNNGTLVKNGWAKDSKGWCFLSAVDGSWVQEGWALDSHGWGYIRNGYWVEHATWAKDSKGWNFIGANGYLDATVAIKATNPIDDATAAVVKAEASKLAADITAATTLVNALDAAIPEKAALTTRIAAINTNLQVVSLNAVDATTLEITFNKAVDNADDIETAGNRIKVLTASEDVTNAAIVSNIISFNDDNTVATVKLNSGLATGVKYTVALVDDNSIPALAQLVVESAPTVLMGGLVVPTSNVNDDQDKLIVNYNKKMDVAALTAGNYTVYDSGNNIIAGVFSGTTDWVDSDTKKSVELELNPGVLLAGKTYKIQVNNANVIADDGTTLSASQSVFTVSTPSISAAKPVVKLVQVVSDDTISVVFDKDLMTNAAVDTNLITVSKSNGSAITLTGAAISGDTLTLSAAAGTFEAGKTYTVAIPANIGINNTFRNVGTDAATKTVTAATNVAATAMTAKFVVESGDNTKYDLVMTFNQPVDPSTIAAGDIVINKLGSAYNYNATDAAVSYSDDVTGKSVKIVDVATNFAALSISGTGSYQVVAKAGAITTATPATPAKTNVADLKATIGGVDVAAPGLDTVTLVSNSMITVKFDETIDVAQLSAGDISVLGFIKNLDGSVTQTVLTGSSMLKFSASGDTLTITPANSSVKFATGLVGGAGIGLTNDIVEIAANTIEDVNGIKNSAAYGADLTDLSTVVDNAAPVLLAGTVTAGTSLDATYSEDVVFKNPGGLEYAQFSVSGVAINGTATAAATANNVITLTFGAGTFVTPKDYSAAKLSYIKNTNYNVKEATGDNVAVTTTLTGLEN